MPSRRLFLVRHGSVENPRRVRYGHLPGFQLSDLGRQQAASAARSLEAENLRDPLLLSSPLERTLETAAILAAHLRLPAARPDPRLIEIGSRYDGLPRSFAPLAYLARLRDPSVRARDESVAQVAARMLDAIDEAFARHPGDVVLVSHQVPIRAALVALTHGLASLQAPLPGSWLLRLVPIEPGPACVVALARAHGRRWYVVRHTEPR